ncbi:MAG: winged helix-turn-helix transcriptional regulator [Reyranellaceae bacterium]
MPRSSFAAMNCAIAQTLEQVGEWWTMLILRNAFCGMSRFDDFHDHLGIASNVLAARLAKLTRSGILKKTRARDDGRAFEYRLTEKGSALYPVLIALTDWGERFAASPGGARIVFVDKRTRRRVRRVAVTDADGRTLRPRDIVARPGRGADEKIRALLEKRFRPR